MARLQDFQTVTPTSSDNLLIVQSQGQGLASVGSTLGAKMDKANPTGTGALSLNRASGSVEGAYSTTEGLNCTASGIRSHAEGSATTASGDYGSHSEGNSTTATGNYGSHAEGSNSQATGVASHAEGNTCVASGDMSHADGNRTIANHKAQHAFGEFNVADTSSALATARGNYIEIVGKGSSDANRSNARTLDWSGNEVLAGGLTINGNETVMGTVTLEDIAQNTEKTYTIPSSFYSGYGVYLLTTGNTYGVGCVAILRIASSQSKMNITELVSSTYFSVSSVAANQFKLTSGNATAHVNLTRLM